jgi:hypothetical protein
MTSISRGYVIGRTAFRTDINGKESLRRPKHSMIEVVEPKEELIKRNLMKLASKQNFCKTPACK